MKINITLKPTLRKLLGAYLSLDEVLAIHPSFVTQSLYAEEQATNQGITADRKQEEIDVLTGEVKRLRTLSERTLNAVAMLRKITK